MMFTYKLLCGKITEWQIFLLVLYYILFLQNTIRLYHVVYDKSIINTFIVLLISCLRHFIFFITHTESKFIFANSPHAKPAVENVGKGPVPRFVLLGEAPADHAHLRRTVA